MSVSNDKVSTLKDFSYLSKEIQSATPTGVKSDDYKPTNSPQACPPVGSNWRASNKLPPTPDEDLCSCMESSLSCVLKDNVKDKEIGKLFGTVCGHGVCDGINGNSTRGHYGAYSMCSPKQQLSYAMNQYYKKQNKNKKACDFDGAASTQSASKPSGSCAKKIKQATGAAASGASATGAGGAGSSTSSGAAAPMGVHAAIFPGAWQLGMYIGSAVVAGVGMVWL